jgi:hypothetical protein
MSIIGVIALVAIGIVIGAVGLFYLVLYGIGGGQ